MNLIKPKTLSVLHKPYRFDGEDHFVVSPVCVFTLGDEPKILKETDQEADFNRYLSGNIFDLGMPKGKAEYIIVGSAYAEPNKPTRSMFVEANVAGLTKRVYVRGNQTFKKGWFKEKSESMQPDPFVSIPLDYKYALGGALSANNPVGAGVVSKDSGPTVLGANLLSAKEESAVTRNQNISPAAYGPVGVNWPEKINQAGTYDLDWQNNHNPGYPLDIDFCFFNRAAADQQTSRYFKGGDSYSLTGMHSSQATLIGKLPSIEFRTFVEQEGACGDAAPSRKEKCIKELDTVIDTVWFFPDVGIGVMVGRASCTVEDCEALDVSNLMLAYESVGSGANGEVDDLGSRRTLEYYKKVLAMRTHPTESLKHVFNESQLTPEKSEEIQRQVVQKRKDYHKAQADRAREMEQKLQSLIQGEATASAPDRQHNLNTDEEGTNANEHLVSVFDPSIHEAFDFNSMPEMAPEETPTPEEIATGEFDLSAFIDYSQACSEQAALNAKKLEIYANEQIEAVEARNSAHKEKSDSLEPFTKDAPFTGDPIDEIKHCVDQIAAVATKESDSEVFDECTDRVTSLCERIGGLHQVAEAVAEQPAMHVVGEAKREWVAKLLSDGGSLAGLNLAYANLSGMDLSKQDLTGCDLREANLSCCSFKNSKLINVNLLSAYVVAADFEGCEINNVNMSGINATNSRFSGARVESVCFHKCCLEGSVWSRSSVTNTTISFSDFSRSDFSGAILTSFTIVETKLTESQFNKATISILNATNCAFEGVNFSGATLNGVAWVGSVLTKASFTDCSVKKCTALSCCSFSGCDFSGAIVKESGFGGVDFSSSCLDSSVFSRCNLSDTNLHHCSMISVSFAFSLLNGANVSHCNAKNMDVLNGLCRKADFRSSDVAASNFAGADLYLAKFDEADVSEAVFPPMVNLENVKRDFYGGGPNARH